MKSLSFTSQLLAACALVALVAVSISLVTSGPPVARAADDAAAKGKVMVESICIECHSPRLAGDPYKLDPAKLYTGGEPFEGPWGAVYAKNITSDTETGIGTWTFAEIKAAINKGIGKNGEKLLVMPWELFQGLADDDLNNIVTYLKTVPAIKSTPPVAKLAPPEAVAGFIRSIPPLAAVVPEALFSKPRDVFHDFVFAGGPTASKPAPAGFVAPQGTNSAARGGYLVRNLLGCAACHGVNLAGGVPPFNAANITPDKETGIGAWSDADIAKALREGIDVPTGRKLSPVMPSTTAYVNLPNDEMGNVIAYLRSIPPVRRAAGEPNPAYPPPGPPPAAPPAAPTALPNTGDQMAPWLMLTTLGGLLTLAFGLFLRRRSLHD